jgi:drug/metabolite transporter (DMT)-like permease
MELWIAATLAAALFQTMRFALQKRLRGAGLSATGATWARFLWSAPALCAGLGLWLAATDTAVPPLTARFWVFAVAGGIAQILATVAVVALFSLRHFAVGITLKKTEVLQTVLAGWLILGEGVSGAALLAMLLGLGALWLLSGTPELGGWRALTSRAMGLGLASGAAFAVAGVTYRGATLELGEAAVGFRAALALTLVTLVQVALMAAWFALRDRAEAGRVLAAWRPGLAVGLTGLAGSLCWFVAFAEQTAAHVYALGQVELLFSVAGGALLFGERLTRREYAGIAVLMVSLVALVLAV